MDPSRREQLLSLYKRLLRAWNARDADAFAATFAEDGCSVGFDGSSVSGRLEIAKSLRGIFKDHQTASYVAGVREIRQLAAEVLLIRSEVGMAPPGKSELNPELNAIQSIVAIEQGAELRIALLHNTPAAFHGRPEESAGLTHRLTQILRSGRIVAED